MAFAAAPLVSSALTVAGGGVPLGGFAFATGLTNAISTIGTVVSVVSTVAGVASAVEGNKFQTQAAVQTQQNQAATSDYNAQVARNNAAQARNAALIEASELRTEARRKTSAIRARLAAGGVVTTAGSALLAATEQEAEGARAAEKRLYSGELQAQGFEQQAELDTFRGQIAQQNVGIERGAGSIRQTSTVLQGVRDISTVGTNIL